MKKIFTYIMLLTLTMGAMTSCDSEDQYLADKLRNRDWQGYIGEYYQSYWGLTGNEYATVMRFRSTDPWATSGRGDELDYNTRSPRNDYFYATFKWFIVDGEITLLYDDDKWHPIYIIKYGLSTTNFYGYLWDGTNREIRFDLQAGTYSDWDYYRRNGGYYGSMSNRNYYYSREAIMTDDEDAMMVNDGSAQEEQPVLLIDRTDEVRQLTGISDAYSIASGAFAEALSKR